MTGEQFTICIKAENEGYRYTVINPDGCYSSGKRDTLAQVWERVESEMRNYVKWVSKVRP